MLKTMKYHLEDDSAGPVKRPSIESLLEQIKYLNARIEVLEEELQKYK